MNDVLIKKGNLDRQKQKRWHENRPAMTEAEIGAM